MIRKIKNDELDALLHLYTHMLEEDDPLPDRAKIDAVWKEILNDSKLHYFVTEEEKQLIACCHLVIVPNLSRGLSPFGLIENVVTHKDFRRQGFGKAVLKHALDFAWKNDCYKVMLLTGRLNESVFRFYESVGFSRQGKQAFIARPQLRV